MSQDPTGSVDTGGTLNSGRGMLGAVESIRRGGWLPAVCLQRLVATTTTRPRNTRFVSPRKGETPQSEEAYDWRTVRGQQPKRPGDLP